MFEGITNRIRRGGSKYAEERSIMVRAICPYGGVMKNVGAHLFGAGAKTAKKKCEACSKQAGSTDYSMFDDSLLNKTTTSEEEDRPDLLETFKTTYEHTT